MVRGQWRGPDCRVIGARLAICGHSTRIAAALIRPGPGIEQRMSKARARFGHWREIRKPRFQFSELALDLLKPGLGLAFAQGQGLCFERFSSRVRSLISAMRAICNFMRSC